MHIGIDASNARSGGIITHIAELLAHADPQRHGITKVTVWGASVVLDRIPRRPWIDAVHVPMLERRLPWRSAWQLFERSRTASAAGCDVLFAPSAAPVASFQPYVTMSANLLPFEPRERARYGWSRQGIRFRILRLTMGHTFRESSAVIFLTEHARSVVSSRIGLNGSVRTAVIPSGVHDRFRTRPRPARPLSSYSERDPFRFLYVSDVHPYKHTWNVAEAVARLRREGLPVALDLIGSPIHRPSAQHLDRTLAELSRETDAIRFLGPLSHDSLPPIYREAGTFVFASTCENLPLSLVEAMASGLPIAASQTRPMPDLLGDGAVYFDAENVTSIADTLRALAADPARRDAIARGAYEAAARYSWDECADRTFALLAQVARK
ncbi:MAG TPA: glycosyltransferase family 1 protein [Thermoanaerobaculia bacterium]